MTEQQRQLAFAQSAGCYQPLRWEQIPDLGLYMDQVITFMDRQCAVLYGPQEHVLTRAMVNNYVKMGLVTRPVDKKYSRESLSQLLMVCTLKQALSTEGIKQLLALEPGQTQQELYEHFRTLQANSLQDLSRELPLSSAMTCAVCCATYRFLCNYTPAEQSEEA